MTWTAFPSPGLLNTLFSIVSVSSSVREEMVSLDENTNPEHWDKNLDSPSLSIVLFINHFFQEFYLALTITIQLPGLLLVLVPVVCRKLIYSHVFFVTYFTVPCHAAVLMFPQRRFPKEHQETTVWALVVPFINRFIHAVIVVRFYIGYFFSNSFFSFLSSNLTFSFTHIRGRDLHNLFSAT